MEGKSGREGQVRKGVDHCWGKKRASIFIYKRKKERDIAS